MLLPRENAMSPVMSRRQLLAQTGQGFGLVSLAALLQGESKADSGLVDAAPLSTTKTGHHTARAKRIIFLFMNGGPSQIDLFDPKPRLNRDHGKPLPFEKPKLARTTTENIMGCPFPFQQYGRSGIPVSTLLPHIGSCIDDICVIRSMVADNINHSNACLRIRVAHQTILHGGQRLSSIILPLVKPLNSK